MRWIVDAFLEQQCSASLYWLKEFVKPFDLSKLQWLRISHGEGAGGGVYGRCWYPESNSRLRTGFRISCQIQPGPWPGRVRVSHPPIYRTEGMPWPAKQDDMPEGHILGEPYTCPCTGRSWMRVHSFTTLAHPEHAMVWIVGHELFHFLSRSAHTPRRNTEIEADAFGDDLLKQWQQAVAAKESP